MASLKWLVLFAALFVIAVQAKSASEDDEREFNIAKIIEVIIMRITDALSKFYKIVEKYLDYFSKDGLDHIQTLTMKYAEQIMKMIDDFVDNRVMKVEKDLDKDGMVLYNCVKQNIANINPAILSYWDNATKCANADIRKLAEVSKPILEALAKADTNIAVAAKDLEKCGPIDTTCLLGVALEILTGLSNLPGELMKDVWDLWMEITKLWPALQDCSVNAGNFWITEIFQQMGMVVKCIKQ